MIRLHLPDLTRRIVTWRRRRRRREWQHVAPFLECLSAADLVVATGGGFVTDAFWWQAERVLTTLSLASIMGKPTAMLGQGLGPISSPRLRALAARTLRRIDLLTLREGAASLPVLDEVSVDRAKAIVTGDDAIEVAYGRHAERLGA